MKNNFLVTAVIVSHLDAALKVASQLTITASNARALSFRAGNGALGFRPLTDYINRLASITVSSAVQINEIAGELCRVATEKDKTEQTLKHIGSVYIHAKDSPHLAGLNPAQDRNKQRYQELTHTYQNLLKRLQIELKQLEDELRASSVVVTMSRVEALQADSMFQSSLQNVADNVEQVTLSIKKSIDVSQRLVLDLKKQVSHENL